MFKLLESTETTRKYALTLEKSAIERAVGEVEALNAQSQNRMDSDTIASQAFHKVIQDVLEHIQEKDNISFLNILNVALDNKEATVDTQEPKSDGSVHCIVDIECLPPVPWKELEGKNHTSIVFKPSDEELQSAAEEELKQKAGDLIDTPKVSKTSFVQVKISCTVDGKPLPAYTAQKAYIDMNKQDFWPEVLTDLLNKKVGDEFKTAVTLKETSSPLLRNKEAAFDVKILGIKIFNPAKKPDNAAAQKIGAKSFEDFLKQFKEHATQTGAKTAREIEHKAIMGLVAKLDFSIPESIYKERVAQQTTAALEAVQPRKRLLEEEARYVEEVATREAKLVTFVLSYAKEKKVSVSSKDIKAVYTPKTPEEREFYEGILLEGKVLESVKALLKVTQKTFSFKELQKKINDGE